LIFRQGTSRLYDRKIDAVIFDLGGVICDFDFALAHRCWGDRLGRSTATIREQFAYDDVCASFERGEMSAEDFTAYANGRFGASLSLDEFAAGWNAIFKGPCTGIEDIVADAQARVRTVVLSNTNVIHTLYWRERYRDLLAGFERVFASQEIGARKPESRAFRIVLDYLNLPPSRVAFFDDFPPYVHAAGEMGMHAFEVTDSHGIARNLSGLLG
jgi:putative hydrolase of the HAD superfamily